MGKNIVDPNIQQMTIWRMRIVCWTPKATKTFSKYVIHFAFPLQQYLHESASMLCDTYITSLVIKLIIMFLISLHIT
jgi:hypothetical protein